MLYLKKISKLKRSLVSPFLYFLLIPIFISDIFVEIYHHICFPVYKIPLVKRKTYIKIDRHKLKYLTFPQKIGCVYCGYANGVISYWADIAGKTEEFFCGIMHQSSKGFIPPQHHQNFASYNNQSEFKKKYL